jgi:hypothetical protein
MAAIVTDQFRILNANNFIDSVLDTNNSYYVFLGLSNPNLSDSAATSFGRTSGTTSSISNWDNSPPSPTDNFQYVSHYRDTSLFGKKITSENIRRVVKKHQWTKGIPYDMYRHDYGRKLSSGEMFQAPNSKTSRLYDSNYYVVNKDYKVYICIDNGANGIPGTDSAKGTKSLHEPISTDLNPFSAGDDNYVWKYLFTISPSDIIKFDSTEYIVLPNNWDTTTDSSISTIREAGNSDTNQNQIKKVYIENPGINYFPGQTIICDIIGDGSGARVSVTTDAAGKITSTSMVSGGSGYTYGVVDLKQETIGGTTAKLIPIIPPSKGHGFNIYKELGADKVLVYSRFDDSTKDFPTDSKFAQVGILKNPTQYSATATYTQNSFSSLYALKLNSNTTITESEITIGSEIRQTYTIGNNEYKAKGYIASYDRVTKVLKYYKDRSLFFNPVNKTDQTDFLNITKESNSSVNFSSSDSNNLAILNSSGTTIANIDSTFSESSINGISLDVSFQNGVANPEINKKTGDVIYIDNRPLVSRDIRQKEDIKIILEF